MTQFGAARLLQGLNVTFAEPGRMQASLRHLGGGIDTIAGIARTVIRVMSHMTSVPLLTAYG
jgi:hypothetical protein